MDGHAVEIGRDVHDLRGHFHLHRVWGLFDREGYASFWLGLLNEKGWIYYAIMLALAILCVLGIFSFFRNLGRNYWWRWIYVTGGCYLLFDLCAIFTGLKLWNELMLWTFDVSSPWWNAIWLSFVALGAMYFGLGIYILVQYIQQEKVDKGVYA
mgnify:CR=1 FL=1